MNKQVLFLFLINFNLLFSMGKYQNIKPNSLAPRVLKNTQTLGCDPNIISQYSNLILCHNAITYIVKEKCVDAKTESYTASTQSGADIFCTYFPTGEFAGEIWTYVCPANFSFLIPIPQQNFFIVRKMYIDRHLPQFNAKQPSLIL